MSSRSTFRCPPPASIWSVVILVASSIFSYAQTGTLSGTVVDAATSKPLPFASVYVNRTTIGAEADGEGKFTLQKLPAGKVEIICSFVGYQSTKIELQFTEREQQQITIKLPRLANELETITVTAEKDNQWKKNYTQFRKVFLGKDDFAEQCEIVNAGVLEFSKSKGNLLTAVASAPLEVINPALGYRITYDLSKFEFSSQQYTIQGNIRFEIMRSDDSKLTTRWKENRTAAYTKSLRYFFKSIFDNRLSENGFNAYVESETRPLSRASLFSYTRSIVDPFLPARYLKKTSDATFFVLTLPGRMEIHDKRQSRGAVYRDLMASVSWLETKEPLIISRTGIVQNPSSLQLIGYMSEPRVAQLLPEDYVPESAKALETTVAAPQKLPLSEKIYVHTDKDYYYPGDVIWFKGYIHYSDPSKADSLSRVVYVEFIDSTKKILLRKTLPVDYGTFNADIALPLDLPTGNYLLRSYTEYMRNFGEVSFFRKPIPILDAYQRVNDTPVLPRQSQPYSMTIQPSKAAYKKREEIKLTIAVRDGDGAVVPADLSVSVVNGELFKLLPEEKSLIDVYSEYLPITTDLKYAVEKGITLRGKFSADKKITEPVKITVVLGKFEDVNSLTTDLNGNFYLTGFQFSDSSNIALQALNKKGKPYGTFTLAAPDLPGVTLFPKQELSLVKASHPVPKISDFEAGAIQLKEVTVSAKKQRSVDLYGGSGFKIDRDFIKKTNYPDIITLMQARIPGLRVIQRMDGSGLMREMIQVIGMGTDPLLVVDGVAYSETSMDVARAIRQISIREVQSIELLRGSSAAIFGTRGMNGAILINTRAASGNYEDIGFDLPDKTFSYFPFRGYSSANRFKYPDYNDTPHNERPDYRTTLYWNPTVWLEGTEAELIRFSAGDISSTYRIVVKGVTVTGEPVTGEAEITIGD